MEFRQSHLLTSRVPSRRDFCGGLYLFQVLQNRFRSRHAVRVDVIRERSGSKNTRENNGTGRGLCLVRHLCATLYDEEYTYDCQSNAAKHIRADDSRSCETTGSTQADARRLKVTNRYYSVEEAEYKTENSNNGFNCALRHDLFQTLRRHPPPEQRSCVGQVQRR